MFQVFYLVRLFIFRTFYGHFLKRFLQFLFSSLVNGGFFHCIRSFLMIFDYLLFRELIYTFFDYFLSSVYFVLLLFFSIFSFLWIVHKLGDPTHFLGIFHDNEITTLQFLFSFPLKLIFYASAFLLMIRELIYFSKPLQLVSLASLHLNFFPFYRVAFLASV